jgi:hypothetical protein
LESAVLYAVAKAWDLWVIGVQKRKKAMKKLKIVKIAEGVFRHDIEDSTELSFYNSIQNNINIEHGVVIAKSIRYRLNEVEVYDGATLIPNTTLDALVLTLHGMGYNIIDNKSSGGGAVAGITGFSTEAKQLPNNHQVTVSNIATLATEAKQLPDNHQVTVSNTGELATHAKQDVTNQKLDSIIANTTPDAGWDTITPTFNATSDVYAYSLAGTVNKVITINYTNASKEVIQNIVKS